MFYFGDGDDWLADLARFWTPAGSARLCVDDYGVGVLDRDEVRLSAQRGLSAPEPEGVLVFDVYCVSY